ncbi:ABC transporter ATP-binding protein [Streptomyces sp. CA-111067]|uniref:ABC transporter ATP-binding protein n=1 Tax=Streptomyces sp. CA-111067 TaxID=3240046 RepID=UPI003D988CEF
MTSTGTPDAALPIAGAARARRAALDLLRPHRGLAATALLTLVAGTVLGLAVPWLLGRIVDTVTGDGGGTIGGTALLLLSAAVGQAVFTSAGTGLTARLAQTAAAALRERVVERALRLPARRIETTGTGDLVSRVTGDVESVNEAATGVLPTLTDTVLTLALTLAALILLDWRFALAGLVAVPFQIVALRWYLRAVVPFSRRERVAAGALAQRVLDSVDGVTTVRAFRLGDRHAARIEESSATARDLSITMAALQRRFFGRLNYGELAGLCAILATGFLLVRDGSASVGAATAAALYFHRLFTPFNTLLGLFDDAQYAGASFARLVGIADLPPAPDTPGPKPRDASVRLTGLRYGYRPDHEVLHGVDLDVEPGRHVAVVGTSGAGKSTLAMLAAGVHLPGAGRVLLGGVPTDDLGGPALRRHCVLLTQETHVFAGPLADDLRLVDPSAGEAELLAALDRVGALEWVHALPEGLNTPVGQGGHHLTGAQTQQLALARLVLADPPVAVLDEATAEAGSTNARLLEEAAGRALAGRTAVIVAHRLTQAAGADHVVLLDAGRVAESGSHAELLSAEGEYAGLWHAWQLPREHQG